MMNQLKTILLMGVLSVILITIGGLIAGSTGAVVCLVLSLGMNLYQYFYSDQIVIRSSGASPAHPSQHPQLYGMVNRLSAKAGLPMPKVYIMPSAQPNAFATGRNPENAAVVVTQGLMQLLSESEMEGVIAHELAHIKNRDILIGTVAAAIASAISSIASIFRWGAIFGGFGSSDDDNGGMIAGLVMAILAPIAAMFVQLAVSRSREYLADETGAKIAGNPRGLANALLRMENSAKSVQMRQAQPSMAHMYIVNPLTGSSFAELFSTHPSTQNRVERLMRMTV